MSQAQFSVGNKILTVFKNVHLLIGSYFLTD